MSAAKRMEPSGDIGKLSPISSGAYGMMNDFEKIMSELGGGSVSDEFVTKDYSQADVDALKARFEETEGAKTDTFDSYVNKMASAYQLLKDRIEDKYAASGDRKEYYTAEDGSTQELTKEKELEMLDKAYETYESGNYRIVPDNEGGCFDIYNKQDERIGAFDYSGIKVRQDSHQTGKQFLISEHGTMSYDAMVLDGELKDALQDVMGAAYEGRHSRRSGRLRVVSEVSK